MIDIVSLPIKERILVAGKIFNIIYCVHEDIRTGYYLLEMLIFKGESYEANVCLIKVIDSKQYRNLKSKGFLRSKVIDVKQAKTIFVDKKSLVVVL